MELDDILRALSHPIRREILWLVWDREMLAGDLAERFDVAGPTVSAHLKVLREADLVDVTRDGTKRLYRARPDVLQTLQRLLFSRAVPEGIEAHHADLLAKGAPPVAARRAFEIAVHATLSCPIETAWALWTDAEHMSWVGDAPVSDPTPGGTFGFTSPFGIQIRGIYQQLAPPVFLSFRWDFSSEDVPIPPAENITYITFASRSEGTAVDLRQYLFDEAIVPLMEAGWTDTFARLSGRFPRRLTKI